MVAGAGQISGGEVRRGRRAPSRPTPPAAARRLSLEAGDPRLRDARRTPCSHLPPHTPAPSAGPTARSPNPTSHSLNFPTPRRRTAYVRPPPRPTVPARQGACCRRRRGGTHSDLGELGFRAIAPPASSDVVRAPPPPRLRSRSAAAPFPHSPGGAAATAAAAVDIDVAPPHPTTPPLFRDPAFRASRPHTTPRPFFGDTRDRDAACPLASPGACAAHSTVRHTRVPAQPAGCGGGLGRHDGAHGRAS